MMYAAENDTHHGAAAAASPDFDDPAPNLEVIYQAFGEHADLYKDVLQVKSSATAEQIQMAYFDRRSELFALLASIDSEEEQDDITASHRFHAERKMDAVVMAVRILGDPQLRQEYDNVMVLRETKKHPKEPPSGSGASRSSSNREPDGVYAGVVGVQVPPSPRSPRSPKRRSPKRRSPRHVSPSDNDATDDAKLQTSASSEEQLYYATQHQQTVEPDYEFIAPANSKGSTSKKQSNKHHHSSSHRQQQQLDSSYDPSTLNFTRDDDDTLQDTLPYNDDTTYQGDEGTFDDTKLTWDDQGTIGSDDWTKDSRRLARGSTSALSAVTNVGFVSRIQEEVAGTVEDTLVSFEQVLNAFTLQERDIQAVMGRIDKAKRQLRKRK